MNESAIELRPFGAAALQHYRALITDAAVTKHMPLAESAYSDEWIRNWIESKSSTWSDESFGPWSVWVAEKFAGWAGLEPDGDDLSLGIVLHKTYWGLGRDLVGQIMKRWPGDLSHRRIVVEFPLSRKSGQWASRLPLTLIGEIEIEGQLFEKYELDPKRIKA